MTATTFTGTDRSQPGIFGRLTVLVALLSLLATTFVVVSPPTLADDGGDPAATSQESGAEDGGDEEDADGSTGDADGAASEDGEGSEDGPTDDETTGDETTGDDEASASDAQSQGEGEAGEGEATTQATTQAADTDPRHVSFRLEGCRNPLNDPIYSPDDDSIVCHDDSYTPSNLGKQWNELDLVPHRLTTTLGSQANATTAYTVVIAADHLRDGHEGYDIISEPVVNRSLSHGSCDVTVGEQRTEEDVVGGSDEVIYREITITQDRGTTCVFDWYQRLAIGASDYAGSSLHAYLLNKDLGTQGIGKKDVPVPVQDILAQEVSKTMDAVWEAVFDWDVTKDAEPAEVHFLEACPPANGDITEQVDITVTWTRSDDPTGDITITTEVFATNPANRSFEVRATDTIFGEDSEGNEVVVDEVTGDWVVLPAQAEDQLILEHEVTFDPDEVGVDPDRGFWDEATVEYGDPITGGDIEALETEATAAVEDPDLDPQHEAVTITDTEWIEGDGVSFSIDAVDPDIGAFEDGYELGDVLEPGDEVTWTHETDESGSVTFTKTIHLEEGTVLDEGDASLEDAAQILGDDAVVLDEAELSVAITSDATVALVIEKEVAAWTLDVGESQDFEFLVEGPEDFTETVTITIDGDADEVGEYVESETLTGLEPGTYTVTEQDTEGWRVIGDASQTVELDPAEGCVETVRFENEPLAGIDLVKTLDGEADLGDEVFEFTLFDNGDVAGGPVTVTGADNTASFDGLEPGTYRLCETDPGEGWTFAVDVNGTTVTPTSTEDGLCVTLELEAGDTVTVSWDNIPPGDLVVAKEVTGEPDGDEVFSFTVDCVDDATFDLQDGGSETFEDLPAGTTCTVTETDDADADETSFTVTVNGEQVDAGVGHEVSVEIPAGATVTVTFTNHFVLVVPVSVVSVTKTVMGDTPDEDAAFSFTLYELEEGERTTQSWTETADADNAWTVTFGGLEPGDYELCEDDLPDGWTMTITDADGEELDADDGCVTFTLVGFELVNLTADNVPPSDIELVKEADVDEAQVGDTVTYTFTITNTGQTTLTGVTLTDDVIGEIDLPTTTLEPGETIVVEVDYVVDEADVDQDELVVENVAIAVGQPPVGDGVSAVDVAVVEIFEQALMPAIPEEELPVTGFDALQTLLAALLALALGGATLLGLRLHELRGRRYGTA